MSLCRKREPGFIDHKSRDLAQTTSAAKTSQNKGFSES